MRIREPEYAFSHRHGIYLLEPTLREVMEAREPRVEYGPSPAEKILAVQKTMDNTAAKVFYPWLDSAFMGPR